MSTNDKYLFAALTLLGFSFWFFLGFPYANHNESYLIVAQLKGMSLTDVLTQRLIPVANYRPLGQVVAWAGYRLGGGNIFPVECFNYAGAVAAWLILFASLRERKVFSVVALIVGGVLFSGYIYLFHLHGVFYSPLLILLAMLFWVDTPEISVARFVCVSLAALIVAFFHPYALPVYVAAVAGLALEKREFWRRSWKVIVPFFLLAFLLLVVLVIVPRHDSVLTRAEMIDGLIASYRMVEINTIVSVAVLCLTVATGLSMPGGAGLRYGAAFAGGAIGVLCVAAGLPALAVWVAMSMLKTVCMRKWWLLLVLCGTALFPAPAATGSPTYAVFALMVCAGILPMGWEAAERRLGSRFRIAAIVAVSGAIVLLVLLRAGVHVPVLSRAAQPLLAEKEKTYQMEHIVTWLINSDYASYEPTFVRGSKNPKDAADAIDRTHRPPTDQPFLTSYVAALRGPWKGAALHDNILWVGFGDEEMPEGTLLLAIPSPNAGEARVVLPPPYH